MLPQSEDQNLEEIHRENMDPRLYKAAMKGDMKLLTSIMEPNDRQVPNLSLRLTPQKNTVLHIAVEFKQQDILKKLIEKCPSLISQPNCKGDTPLHVAARDGCLDLIKILTPTLVGGNLDLERGNTVWQASSVALKTSNLQGSNPIHEALKKSHGEVALHLLTFGERLELACEVQVNMAGESLLYLAAEAGLAEVVQKIISKEGYSTQGPDGQNPLHIAVIKGQLEVVKILMDRTPHCIQEVDVFGKTALHYASAIGYRRVVREDDNSVSKKGENKNWIQEFKQKRTHEEIHLKILEVLLKRNPSLAYVPDQNGDYPLLISAAKDFDEGVDTILDNCPDSAELVNREGQNALHLAVMKKNRYTAYRLTSRLESEKLINEPDNDGNTPIHLATRTYEDEDFESLLIHSGAADLTITNKQGLTALDICGSADRERRIRDTLSEAGAVPSRHLWQSQLPRAKVVNISPEFKKAMQTLPVVTSLVATVTFAAAFTVPGGYKNDGPQEGLPVFMRNAAMQAFMLSDIIAFCTSMVATVLLVYANRHSEDAFKIYYTLKTCHYISAVAILATITAFATAVYVLTSNESLWLAVAALVLGSVVPLFLLCYTCGINLRKLKLFIFDNIEYSFESSKV